MQRAVADLDRRRARRSRPAAVAAPRRVARGFRPLRRTRTAARRPRRSTTTRSCASRATACTRSRWARCTPASSSRGISASRSSAKRCCGSRSGSATCTRASSGASPSCRCSRAIASRRASPAIPPWRSPGPTARRSRAMARARRAGARGLAARAGARARAHRQSSRRPRRARQRCRLRLRPGAVLAPEGTAAARDRRRRSAQRYLLDFVVPGRRRASISARAQRRRWRERIARLAPRRGSCATSTTSTPACATASSAPARSRRSSRAARPHRARRPRERAGLRPARRPALRALRRARRRARSCAAEGDVAARVAVRFDELHRILPAGAARSCARLPPGRIASRSSGAAGRRLAASDSSRAGAARCWSRSKRGADGTHPPLPSARSVVAELAGARARDHRQHRSGLSADQQVLQPLLQRARSLAHAEDAAPDRIASASSPSPRRRGRGAARCATRCRQRILRGARAGAVHPRTSTPAPATAASWRSTRSTTRSTTSRGSASASSPARGMPTCCWSPGPVSRNMEVALRRTYEATPDPKLVVARGRLRLQRRHFRRELREPAGALPTSSRSTSPCRAARRRPTRILQGILTAIAAR